MRESNQGRKEESIPVRNQASCKNASIKCSKNATSEQEENKEVRNEESEKVRNKETSYQAKAKKHESTSGKSKEAIQQIVRMRPQLENVRKARVRIQKRA